MPEYLFLCLVVAGIATLWRNLLAMNAPLRDGVHSLPFQKALTCGFCFSYWLSLLAIVLWQPQFGSAIPSLRWQFLEVLEPCIRFIASWMVLGMGSVIVRFGYVAIQELVTYQVHQLNGSGHSH